MYVLVGCVAYSTISGGTTVLFTNKGLVANVKLSPRLLSNNSAVTDVKLSNLNLQPQAAEIAKLLPPKVEDLTLINDGFTEIPAGLSNLTSLKTLYVAPLLVLQVTELHQRPLTNHFNLLPFDQVSPRQQLEGFRLDPGIGPSQRTVRYPCVAECGLDCCS